MPSTPFRAVQFWIAPLVMAALVAAASASILTKPPMVDANSGPPPLPPGPQNEHQGPLTASENARFHRAMEKITPLGDIAQHQDELADIGLYIVSDVDQIQPARFSTADDMVVPRPQVLWDYSNQRYYAYASYNWIAANTQDHYYDISNFSGSCVDSPCSPGGYDGFGMRFSRNMENVQVSALFCGRGDLDRDYAYFNCTTPTNPDQNSQQGVTWRKQDKVYKTVSKPDNNMYIGSIATVIKRPSCGPALQIFSRYGHSWSNTGLSGFSASLSGFGMSWSSSNDHWAASSQSGTWDIWDPC